MIHVKRTPPVLPSLDMTVKTSTGARELARFIKNKIEKSLLPGEKDYSAYAGAEVREALIQLFHGKCAYCESAIVGSSQSDIEHYRPKGAVKDAESAGVDHPGYWWLAMVWDNLLLSCMHCNQLRKQVIFTDDMTLTEIEAAISKANTQSRGKKNAFPTENGMWVTDYTVGIDDERPLLIDPTRIDPEPLFEWILDAELPTMRARAGDARARTTIDVLGLNRRHLTEHRQKVLDTLKTHAAVVRGHVHKLATAPHDAAAAIHYDNAREALDAFAVFAKDEKDFSSMARAMLKELQNLFESALAPAAPASLPEPRQLRRSHGP